MRAGRVDATCLIIMATPRRVIWLGFQRENGLEISVAAGAAGDFGGPGFRIVLLLVLLPGDRCRPGGYITLLMMNK